MASLTRTLSLFFLVLFLSAPFVFSDEEGEGGEGEGGDGAAEGGEGGDAAGGAEEDAPKPDAADPGAAAAPDATKVIQAVADKVCKLEDGSVGAEGTDGVCKPVDAAASDAAKKEAQDKLGKMGKKDAKDSAHTRGLDVMTAVVFATCFIIAKMY